MPPARSKIAASLAEAVSDASTPGEQDEGEDAPSIATPNVAVLDHEGEDLVRIEITNLDEAEPLTTGPMDFRLVDRERVPHTVDTDRLDDLEAPFPSGTELAPGTTESGWLVFERPVGEGPRWIRYDGDHGETRTRVGRV